MTDVQTKEDALRAAIQFRNERRPWLVLRHGGRAGDKWRNVAQKEGICWSNPYQQHAAETLFGIISKSLRQGVVVLIGPDNTIVKVDSAPRLRTRW